MDVTVLYSSIPHNDGIGACKKYLDNRTLLSTSIQEGCQLIRFMLEHNILTLMVNTASIWYSYGHQNGAMLRQYFHSTTRFKLCLAIHSTLLLTDDIFIILYQYFIIIILIFYQRH